MFTVFRVPLTGADFRIAITISQLTTVRIIKPTANLFHLLLAPFVINWLCNLLDDQTLIWTHRVLLLVMTASAMESAIRQYRYVPRCTSWVLATCVLFVVNGSTCITVHLPDWSLERVSGKVEVKTGFICRLNQQPDVWSHEGGGSGGYLHHVALYAAEQILNISPDKLEYRNVRLDSSVALTLCWDLSSRTR